MSKKTLVEGSLKGESSTEALIESRVSLEARRLRQDFMIIFGLFASIIAFLTIEVSIFQNATRFSLLIGTSLTLLGSMIFFIFALKNTLKDDPRASDYFKNPLFYMIIAIFVAAGICFAWTSIIKPFLGII